MDIENGIGFIKTRREVAAAMAGVVVAPAAARTGIGPPAGPGVGALDFLHDRWPVRHRKLKARLVGSTEWVGFRGDLDVKPILGDLGNIDESVLDDPAGAGRETNWTMEFTREARR